MKEDYLWDKTGNNAEIKRIENALRSFRYQEIAPPALPSKIVPFEKKSPRRFFKFSFALGAFAALAIVCLGIWLSLAKKNIEIANDSMPIVAPSKIENSPRQSETPKILTTAKPEKIKSPQKFAESRNVKTKFVLPANRRSQTARNVRIKPREMSPDRNLAVRKSTVKLTKDETYAYNQLMRALSITGSQLKIVKDKIDAAENSR